MNAQKIFLIVGLLIGFPLMSMSPDATIRLLLPVNVVSTLAATQRRCNLQVIIPGSFRNLTSLESRKNEFIPKTDSNSFQWSEIITTETFPGSGMQASQFVSHLKDQIMLHSTDGRIIEELNESR